MKYIVQYELSYVHRVQVGIEAESAEAAIATVQRLFDEGDIWQDTTETPLLFDDFEENGDAGQPLVFTIEQELAEDERWPEAAVCVKELRRRDAAFRAAGLLVEAYRRGEDRGGSVDWDDVDQAFEAALQAVPER